MFLFINSYININKNMQIKYGIENNNIDVTEICYKLLKNLSTGIINIPYGDNLRSKYFTDPLIGIHKSIYIYIDNVEYVFDEYKRIKIDTINNKIIDNTINYEFINNEINNKTEKIHSQLTIKYGSLCDELPEQKMSVRYLKGTEKVLEIGGNIGRNSLVISNIINGNKDNMVVMECDIEISKQLSENRDLNNMTFNIESSALSTRKLAQKGWETIVCDNEILPDGYNWVNTITYTELCKKYNIKFDTLVLDCEGAFYYILLDMPEILDNINLIIMENDYNNIEHYDCVAAKLKELNFVCDYIETGGWGPCYSNFYEVWTR